MLTPTDPCQNYPDYFPDFIISENEFDSTGTDTVLINSYVNFQAPNKYQEYEWKIGNDPTIYTGAQLTLFFDETNTVPGELISVQFFGKGFYDSCLSERHGKIDTVIKSFRIIGWDQAPIIGKYEGYFESDKNSKQTIEIRYIDTIPSAGCSPFYGCFRLFNIDKGCNMTITNPGIYPLNVTDLNMGKGAKKLSFDAFTQGANFTNNCHAPKGYLSLSPTNRDSIIAVFTYSESIDNSGKRINEKFYGLRKN